MEGIVYNLPMIPMISDPVMYENKHKYISACVDPKPSSLCGENIRIMRINKCTLNDNNMKPNEIYSS